jgi:hypothetical protein
MVFSKIRDIELKSSEGTSALTLIKSNKFKRISINSGVLTIALLEMQQYRKS